MGPRRYDIIKCSDTKFHVALSPDGKFVKYLAVQRVNKEKQKLQDALFVLTHMIKTSYNAKLNLDNYIKLLTKEQQDVFGE